MKKINFYPFNDFVYDNIDYPKPSKKYLPEWYTRKKLYDGGSPVYAYGEIHNKTVRSCIPFSDALTHGYIQETWCDIAVSKDNDDNPILSFSEMPEPVGLRGSQQIEINTNEFYPLDFTWNVPWFPKVENGYSLLFTHPLNRFDLPFQTTSGIIDADRFYHVLGGSYPFLLKKDFEGIIPKGTPIFQLIPIKRDNWESSSVKYDELSTLKRRMEVKSYFVGAYRRFFHVKKSFN